jgi:hypothetical protein
MPGTMTSPNDHDATDTTTDVVRPRVAMPSRDGEEIWAIQVPGSVSLAVTTFNRFGQAVEGRMVVGPNRTGTEFKIKVEDREENQARCVDPDLDPFRNGMLVRVDADQQADPLTKSEDALSTEQLLDIYDLEGKKFEARVQKLGELPLRRLAEVGESMDCSHRQILFVRELIAERYTKGGPQTTLEHGERLS